MNLYSLISEKIEWAAPFVDGNEYDRKGINSGYDYDETEITDIGDIAFDFLSVNSVSENLMTVSLACRARVITHCTYLDEADSAWDSEDKKYLFTSYGHNEEIHRADFEGLLHLELDGEKIAGIKDIKLDLTLDQSTHRNNSAL